MAKKVKVAPLTVESNFQQVAATNSFKPKRKSVRKRGRLQMLYT